jgi:hypothetical protein
MLTVTGSLKVSWKNCATVATVVLNASGALLTLSP